MFKCNRYMFKYTNKSFTLNVIKKNTPRKSTHTNFFTFCHLLFLIHALEQHKKVKTCEMDDFQLSLQIEIWKVRHEFASSLPESYFVESTFFSVTDVSQWGLCLLSSWNPRLSIFEKKTGCRVSVFATTGLHAELWIGHFITWLCFDLNRITVVLAVFHI